MHMIEKAEIRNELKRYYETETEACSCIIWLSVTECEFICSKSNHEHKQIVKSGLSTTKRVGYAIPRLTYIAVPTVKYIWDTRNRSKDKTKSKLKIIFIRQARKTYQRRINVLRLNQMTCVKIELVENKKICGFDSLSQ